MIPYHRRWHHGSSEVDMVEDAYGAQYALNALTWILYSCSSNARVVLLLSSKAVALRALQ
jgi:hypothetical protein